MATALYPGAYKPPHRGHFNVVKSLLDGSYNGTVYDITDFKEKGTSLLKGRPEGKPSIDKVLIFVGGGERNGIDKQEATKIWEIYAQHLSNVEIIDGQKNPMFAAKDWAKANPNEEFVAVTGLRGEADFVDLRRVTTFKNTPNVKGLAVTTANDSGVRATDFRKSILSGSLDTIIDFFPSELTKDQILGILSNLKEKIVAEVISNNINGFLSEYFAEDATPEMEKEPALDNKPEYTKYIGAILEYMLDQDMNIQPLPEVKVRYDEENAKDFFGKTAHYDPNNKEIVLYVSGRHPKDICRSFTHEMVHHIQNIENRLGNVQTSDTTADNDLLELEKEAYLVGNITFRNWEDSYKSTSEAKKPGLWANINAKKKRGEKPSHGNSNAHKDAKAAGKAMKKEGSVNEIGDLSQEPYKWSAFAKPKDSSDPYTYYDFNTDNGTKYQVIFNREEFGKTVNYDMSFVAKGKDGKGFSADALTGDNEPLKIMSTIVDITREQIKKAGDVEFITFEPTKGKAGEEGAKGNTRSKLYKIIIKKNFPKANVSGTDTVVVDMSAYLNKDLEEATVGNKIECDNCTWSWEKKDAGGDAYTCHKCGHTNKTQALENFKDGKKKGKSRPGRVKKAGASCNGTKAELRAKAKKYGGEKGKMYHWCANMKEDTNETVMAEGKYDKLANKLSGLALETFLDIHDRGDKGGEFEFRVGNPEDPEVDIPSLQFEFDFLGVVEFTEDTYSVDGGANAGYDKEGDEIQPMLNVKFKIQKNPDWQEVSFDLKDVVRHELEHLTQDGENVKPGKYIEDDALVRGMIDMGVMDKDEYYKLPKEVDAMIQGMYFKAKKSRTPFTDVVEDYFEKAGVELENRKKIRILWNKRLPKLGIKQRL